MNGTARGRDWVAIILAVGIATAINLITFAVLYDAVFSAGPGLSENATQVLTTAFGGIIGVLGAFVGFKTGQMQNGQMVPESGREAEVVTGRQEVGELGGQQEEDDGRDRGQE